MGSVDEHACEEAARLIRAADALIITAGAGMGVDSGLPDFRGDGGFWRAYPALGQRSFSFTDVANPAMFYREPRLAWGFYAHRLNLYRATAPHAGFGLLREWARSKPHGAFVFTSNVDGHFQRAGFSDDAIVECHGSVHWLQCASDCSGSVWSADGWQPNVDESRCQLTSELPRCAYCAAIARPNILMFGDGTWNGSRTHEQHRRCTAWRSKVTNPLVIELGAGTAIPSVRHFSESQSVPVVRINPREYALGDSDGVSMAAGALDALLAIDRALLRMPG